MKSGLSWRMLKSPINYKILFWHFQHFIKYNIFFKVFNKIKNHYINKYIHTDCTLLLDSTIINNKYGITKIGRNKFYKNKNVTKLSLITDINGFLLSIFFMKGNYHDINAFNKHIKDALILLPNKKLTLLADKAYASLNVYNLLDKHNI